MATWQWEPFLGIQRIMSVSHASQAFKFEASVGCDELGTGEYLELKHRQELQPSTVFLKDTVIHNYFEQYRLGVGCGLDLSADSALIG